MLQNPDTYAVIYEYMLQDCDPDMDGICDGCERIHPDNIGEYFGDMRTP